MAGEVADDPADTRELRPGGGKLRLLHRVQGPSGQDPRPVTREPIPQVEAGICNQVCDCREHPACSVMGTSRRPRPRDCQIAAFADDMADRDTSGDGIGFEEERVGHSEWLEYELGDRRLEGHPCDDFDDTARQPEPRVVVRPERAQRKHLGSVPERRDRARERVVAQPEVRVWEVVAGPARRMGHQVPQRHRRGDGLVGQVQIGQIGPYREIKFQFSAIDQAGDCRSDDRLGN